MHTPTFKEQFDKITIAYFYGNLQPNNNCACFIGNLLNGTSAWANGRGIGGQIPNLCWQSCDYMPNDFEVSRKCILNQSGGLYTISDIEKMELNFLNIVRASRGNNYENKLFEAMDSTLDMLRKIHESKGEVIESFEFKKRELATV